MLASQSPRRLQILQQVGLKFTVNVSRFEENLDKSSMTPVAFFPADNAIGRVCEGQCKGKGLRGV